MARLGRTFVHEVNVTIVAVVALMAVAWSLHYVSLLREVHEARQQLCAARVEAIAARHPYLDISGTFTDTCEALSALRGEATPAPRSWRVRLRL